MIKYKNRIRKLWQNNNDPQIKTLLNKLTKIISSNIGIYRNQLWNKKIWRTNMDQNKVWYIARKLTKKKEIMPNLKINSTYIIDNEHEANVIADVFENIHKQNNNIGSITFTNYVNSLMIQTTKAMILNYPLLVKLKI